MQGCYITELRKKHGISRSELARRTGISRNTLNNIEQGTTVKIFPKTSTRLARFFGVSAEHIEQRFSVWRRSLITI